MGEGLRCIYFDSILRVKSISFLICGRWDSEKWHGRDVEGSKFWSRIEFLSCLGGPLTEVF